MIDRPTRLVVTTMSLMGKLAACETDADLTPELSFMVDRLMKFHEVQEARVQAMDDAHREAEGKLMYAELDMVLRQAGC